MQFIEDPIYLIVISWFLWSSSNVERLRRRILLRWEVSCISNNCGKDHWWFFIIITEVAIILIIFWMIEQGDPLGLLSTIILRWHLSEVLIQVEWNTTYERLLISNVGFRSISSHQSNDSVFIKHLRWFKIQGVLTVVSTRKALFSFYSWHLFNKSIIMVEVVNNLVLIDTFSNFIIVVKFYISHVNYDF